MNVQFHSFKIFGMEGLLPKVSISFLFVFYTLAIFSYFFGEELTYHYGFEYVIKEINFKAYEIDSDLFEFFLGLPSYPIGTKFSILQIFPPDFLGIISLIGFLAVISFLALSITYFDGLLFYGCLALFGFGASSFRLEVFLPFGFSNEWVVSIGVFVVVFPIYLINAWLDFHRIYWRFFFMFFWYSTFLGILVLFSGINISSSLFSASLWIPLLIGSLAFLIFCSTDVLQGILILLTREENSKQSWLHFSIFSLLYLSHFILIYLKNTGQLVLEIFYPNPIFIQLLILIVSFWLISRKGDIFGQGGKEEGFFFLYVGLAGLFLITTLLSFGLANDLMVEVLEDAICLVNFCMGVVFFLYVVINYFQLMGLGLKVHLVMFQPRYMPVSAIPVFGLAGIFVFLVNQSYFPYFQTIAAKNVLYADHFQKINDPVLAESYLKNSLAFENRNQRANLSLAGFYSSRGNLFLAQEYARNSMEKSLNPVSFLAVAQGFSQKGLFLDEILEYQGAVKSFPKSGILLNNLGMAFNDTKFKDSSAFYLSKAKELPESKNVAVANLGYYYLMNKLENEGLPKKSPESEQSGNWAQINNDLVFANAAREKSPQSSFIVKNFKGASPDIQPFVLYHLIINKAITRDSSDYHSIRSLMGDTSLHYYSEPLDMAFSFWKYRIGQGKSGLEKLIYLYQNATDKKLDFALLLGQIYFEQKSYRTASQYFAKAASMGMTRANYWNAISLLDAGKSQQSEAAFMDAYTTANATEKIRISVFIDGLRSGKFHNAAQRSDPEKSAYLKTNWTYLTDQQVLDLIYLVSDKEMQHLLWRYSFHRAYSESLKSRCKGLMAFGNKLFGNRKNWKKSLEEFQPFFAELTGDVQGLMIWVNNFKGTDFEAAYYRARLAQMAGETDKAALLYKQSIEVNPLQNRQMGVAIGFLSGLKKYRSFAYEKALEISDLDPSNPEFLKLYAILAVKEGLPEFAFQSLPRIEVLTSHDEALQFRKKIEAMVKEKYQTETIIP